MELVYLWVENYKNIKEQGFNFSPRFKCNYDGENLTIEEKEYTSIFPDNINITAIVGENGSGKSSIFEVLTFLYWQGLILNRKDKTFFIFYSNNKFYIQCENYKSLPIHTDDLTAFIKLRNATKIKNPTTFCARGQMPLILFSNCISDITKNQRLQHLKTYANYFNGISSPKILMKTENTSDEFNQKFQFILKQDIGFFKFLDEEIIFDCYQSQIHFSEVEAVIVQNHNEELKKYLSFQEVKTDSKKELIYRLIVVLLIELTSSTLVDKYRKEEGDQPSEYIEEYLNSVLELDIIQLLTKETKVTEKVYNDIVQLCLNSLKGEDAFIKDIFNKDNIDYIFKNYKSHSLPVDKSYTILQSDLFLISDDINNYKSNKLLEYLFSYQSMRFDFFNSKNYEHNFSSLSSGEKLYLNILTNYTYTLLNLNDNYNGVMLFDEIELSFHPNWQKQIIKHLLHIKERISNIKNSNIHLIFSSHSPFLLSDLPKENVIFLENGEQKYPFKDKQTFGANIHTLLSDGFFMSDGLMGEFAKEKINEVIEILKNKRKKSKKNINYCKNIISLVGEPVLKSTLEHMLEEKINSLNSKEEKINILKEKQQKLQNEIDKLKGK